MPPVTVPSALEERATDEAELFALAAALVGFDTRNPPGRTGGPVDFVTTYLADRGVDTEVVAADPEKPNLLATLPGAGDARLLYVGHLDTVDFDRAEWTRDPLGERVDGRLYGRGATDMKGPAAAMLRAFVAYAEAGVEPPLDLSLALVADEETGGDAGLDALLDRDRLAADACVVGEPTCERGRHSVAVADRGAIWLDLAATGTAAHGSRPATGTNAVDRLYAAVEDVREAMADYRLTLDDATRTVLEESVAFYGPTMGTAVARQTFEYPTVNLGALAGGSAYNTVPTTATAKLDVRVTAGVDSAAVLERVEAVLARHDGVDVSGVSRSQGTMEDPQSPLVDAVATTAEAVADARIYRRSATGGGDAKRLRNAGVPTVEFAFGTDTVHAVDEYVTREALVDGAAVYDRLPYALAARLGVTD